MELCPRSRARSRVVSNFRETPAHCVYIIVGLSHLHLDFPIPPFCFPPLPLRFLYITVGQILSIYSCLVVILATRKMDERLRPEPESSRRSPSSPGKRRMVDNEKGKVRLISRGLPDSDEDDRQQVVINRPQVSIPPKEHRVPLDLSVSRKRKTIEPITGEHTILVLPSPTTQIARQIDKIRLAGTPVYGYTGRLPLLGLDTSPGTNSEVGGVMLPSNRPSKDETERMIVHDTRGELHVLPLGIHVGVHVR